MNQLPPIPQEWLRDHVDTLIEAAKRFGPHTAMGKAAMERAHIIMDTVKAFRDEYEKRLAEREG